MLAWLKAPTSIAAHPVLDWTGLDWKWGGAKDGMSDRPVKAGME